jgi:anti-anti-sigma factor
MRRTRTAARRMLARLRELVKRPAIIATLALLVVPAIASANCPTPTKPPNCWEVGIEPTSGACGRYHTEREEEIRSYEQCLQSEREIHERYEREIAEANHKYEERLHEIAEEQKRYEQQQAEAKYAQEHRTPPTPSTPQPVASPPSISTIVLPRFEGEIEPSSGSHSGHRWRVGSRIKLQLLDRRFARTRYRVSINWSNLSGLTFMGSTGVRVVLLARELCERRGYEFRVIPGPANVQHVFKLTGVSDVLPFQELPDVG